MLPTAESILKQNYENFELLVLDQSTDDSTERALEALSHDPRLQYYRLELPGKPLALNRALELASTPYIMITDDDCEVMPDWLEEMVAAFEADAKIGCIFGDVTAASHDPNQGFIPVNIITQDHTISRLWDFLRMPGLVNFGIGASSAVRREAAISLGGFDPCAGTGAKYGSADDHDIAVRMLLADWRVHFSSKARVVHYGFREWKHGASDVRRNGYGFGATFAKYLRCGKIYYGSLRLLVYFFAQILWRGIRFKRPLGVAFPAGWIRGMMAGLRHPLNKTTRCFLPTNKEEILRDGGSVAKIVLRSHQTERESEEVQQTGRH